MESVEQQQQNSNIYFRSKGCSLDSDNKSLEALAIRCLRQKQGVFYDGCSGHCELEMSFLRLSQGFELEHFVYGYLFPILVVMVVVANVLVVLVLSQKQMVSPTNVVLKYMAIADLCVGLIPLPWNFFFQTLRHYEDERGLELWWCYMYKYSMDAIPPVCHNVAMWLTVLLAGQRYISLQYPMRSRHICTVQNVRIATCVITLFSLICGLPKSLDYYFYVYDGWAYVEPGRWIQLRSCLSGFTKFVKLVGSNAFFNVYFWTRVFGFIVLPSLLLICLNTLLIRNIRIAQIRKERLLKEKRAREANRQTDSNTTSIMLVIIVSIFLVVNLPQAFFMAMLCVCNTFGINVQLLEGIFPAAFLLVSNMLVMATYPINFGIYCSMSSSFRDTFWTLFCSSKPPRNRTDSLGAGGCRSEFTRISNARRSDPSVSFPAKLSFSTVNGNEAARNVSTASVFSTSSNPTTTRGCNSLNREDCPSLSFINCSPIGEKPPKTKPNGFFFREDMMAMRGREGSPESQQLIGGSVSPTGSTSPGETIFL